MGDGSGQTLVGRKIAGFGDRVAHSKPDELKEKALKKLQQKGTKQKQALRPTSEDVLNVKISQDELVYRPRTRETQAAYEQMLSIVGKLMGDQPLDILKGALDEVIAILKQDMKDGDRKSEIEAMVDRVSEADFNTLTVLG